MRKENEDVTVEDFPPLGVFHRSGAIPSKNSGLFDASNMVPTPRAQEVFIPHSSRHQQCDGIQALAYR